MNPYSKKICALFLFWLLSIASWAKNYYVSSSTGSDSNDGLSSASPWQSIDKVNKMSFSAGDSILFKKGDVWRETLVVPSSGVKDRYIVFSSYGTGLKPRILGSEKLGNWVSQGSNIWKSDISVSDPYGGTYPAEIFFTLANGNVSWGVHKKSTGDLTAEYQWTWSSNYIYIYSTVDPKTRYIDIEAPQRMYSIHLNSKQYIEINGIDMFYEIFAGVTEQYPTANLSGYILRNCEIAYNGTLSAEGHGSHVLYNNSLIEKNLFHDCGRRSVSINHYGTALIKNVIIQNNIFRNGNHTLGVDLSIGGAGNSGSVDSVIIRNNLFYEDPNESIKYAEGIFLQKYPHGGNKLTGIYIYGNIFMNPTSTSILTERVDQVFIYNNTFYGLNQVRTANVFFIDITQSSLNITIKNNIFYGNSKYNHNTSGDCVYISHTSDYKQVVADYNLYYQEDPKARIVEVEDQYTFHNDDIEQIRSDLGWEIHSPTPADPLFTSETDLHLTDESPAIGAGIYLPVVLTDFEGNAYSDPPNIGCYAARSYNAVPAYLRSSVENATPSLLTMTYNMTLANIVPDNSAFSVTVNSAIRDVTQVSVSDNIVNLTLAEPIHFGDVITVSYTKPAAGPLQSPAGAEAGSISDQAVTNNVASNESPQADSASMVIYPNPASDYINLSITYPSSNTAGDNMDKFSSIRIINLSGKIMYQQIFNTGITSLNLPINLPPGLFIIQLISDNSTLVTGKLVVIN